MSFGLSAETLIPLSRKDRKALILEYASLIDVSNIADEDLQTPYKYGKIISSVAPSYFEYQIVQDRQNGTILDLNKQDRLIARRTDRFADNFIEWLQAEFENKTVSRQANSQPKNLFELCDVKLLSTSNSVTRGLSTRMGALWEHIANISPYVIVPELQFGIKIKGIDVVLLSDNKIIFAQIKTLKGTLTGSQKSRAKKELAIHQNSFFVSAFDLGSWTFNDPIIPHIAGKPFWNMICIDYDILENRVKSMLQKIETAFVALAAQQ